jgi:hypothetical protein
MLRHHRTTAYTSNDSSNALTTLNASANCVETDGNIITANNHSAIDNRHTSRQELLLLQTNQHQQSLGTPFPSNSATDLSHFYLHPIHNNGQPHQLTNSNILINTSLLPNISTPVFTTPTKILTGPSKSKPRKDLSLIKHQPTKKPAQPITTITQIKPNPNPSTLSVYSNRTDPRPALPNPTHDSAVNIDTHTEKKRRREEKRQSDSNDDDSNQHFLSAGPGSQDCRDK